MNPLQLRLAALRRAMIMVNFWRGSCVLFALFVGLPLIVGLADWGLINWQQHLPAALRALFLVGILAVLGVVFVRYLYLPMTRRLDDLSLALRIEEIYPELNDNLASAVQFLDEPEENLPGSKSMRKQVIEHALKRADHCDFANIIDRRGVIISPLAGLVLGVTAACFLWTSWDFSRTALARLVDPFGGHSWTRIELDQQLPERVAQGQRFDVVGKMFGIIPEKGQLEIEGSPPEILGYGNRSRGGRQESADRPIFVKREDGVGMFKHSLDMTRTKGKFRFRILANDGVYPTDSAWSSWIQVLPPPRLVAMKNGQASPQIELSYPNYTFLRSPVQLSPGDKDIQAVAGTKIIWRAAVDRSVAEAWLEHAGRKYPCDLQDDGKLLTVAFTPEATNAAADYTVHFRDSGGLGDKFDGKLTILADPVPNVRVNLAFAPGQLFLTRRPKGQVTLPIQVEDPVVAEVGAIRSIWLELQLKSPSGEWVKGAQWQKVPIVHSDLVSMFASLGQTYLPLRIPVRPEKLQINFPWRFNTTEEPKKFKEGDIVAFRICADDFNDITKREPGRSQTFEMLIVSDKELGNELAQEFKKVRDEIGRLKQLQENAEQIVKDIQANKNTDDAETQRQKLVDAEEKQREIKQIVAGAPDSPDKGLQKDLAALKEKMRENKLPPSDLQDKVAAVAGELERVARVDLPQIEANLSTARRQVGTKPDVKPDAKTDNKPDAQSDTKADRKPDAKPDVKPDAKIDKKSAGKLDAKIDKKPGANSDKKPGAAAGKAKEPKAKDPLEQAQIFQKDAAKTFAELDKFLDPWAKFHQIKDGTNKLLADQRELKKETDRIKSEADKNNDFPDKGQQEELKAKAEAQNALVKKAEDLVKLIKDVAETKDESDDARNLAKKVAEAHRIARNADLPGKISAIGNQLENVEQPRLQNVSQNQEKVIGKLDEIAKALDKEKREEEIEKLTKDRKKAKKKLSELKDKMEKLEKKVQKVRQIADPMERAQEMQKLAPEQKAIEEKAHELARELARLRAEKAARDLEHAANEMAKAEAKMKAGDDPGDEGPKQVQKDLAQTKKDLERVEEELARERLALIADKLKAVKERQDEMVIESERIHRTMVGKKPPQWSRGLLQSLADSGKSQANIAQDTDSLTEKLAGAPVFAHVMKTAKGDMDRAAEAIARRSRDSRDKATDPLEKDDLFAENKQQEKIVKLQKDASKRLQRLVDALKEELKNQEAQQPPDKPGEEQPMNPEGGDEQPRPRPRTGDGIPEAAEIKVLIADQKDLNQRTKEFDDRHPNRKQLNEEQRAELHQLRVEQETLGNLFRQLKAPKGEEQ